MLQSVDSKRDTASASFTLLAAVNLSSTARAWSSTVAGGGDAGTVSCIGNRHSIIANENCFRQHLGNSLMFMRSNEKEMLAPSYFLQVAAVSHGRVSRQAPWSRIEMGPSASSICEGVRRESSLCARKRLFVLWLSHRERSCLAE